MIFYLKVESLRLTPATYLNIVIFIVACGNRAVRNIGNALQHLIKAALHFCQIGISLSTVIFHLLAFSLKRFNILTFGLGFTDQLAHGFCIGVAFLLQALSS